MKTQTTLSIICLLGFSAISQSQTEPKNSEKVTEKPMNLLDAQTQIYGQVFDLGGAGKDNPLGGATNYKELIEKMDATEEQKEKLREQYQTYDRSLNLTEKDSLGRVFENALKETSKEDRIISKKQ